MAMVKPNELGEGNMHQGWVSHSETPVSLLVRGTLRAATVTTNGFVKKTYVRQIASVPRKTATGGQTPLASSTVRAKKIARKGVPAADFLGDFEPFAGS